MIKAKEEFHKLVLEWKSSRPRGVDVEEMIKHPAYQAIISMGIIAVPFLLQELSIKVDHWFPALNLITGENPILPEDEGKLKAMALAWLKWGMEKGYII